MPFFEAETTAYEWIDGKGVRPKFLGHLTEAGRVIGLVMEHIDDARSAQTGDQAACQAVQAKLHSRGIKHGDMAAGEIAGSKQCCRGSSIPPTASNPPRTSAMR
ncbi:hypothetical protein BKA56DRAFT_720921 [Ilyonectria sp. MPI-CAGE-AT-0026]|nr:hypothetical protein BKA56DRAFT_720921 [Ilyonectria sp. MPI-CAGE-AT-0026]